ncbi:HXXEE domain-containing protein [Nocardia australiensis]|uniref:HXXEE domain-containing protein n=1 Tax=Nocardia australiensis TaxID=2887191 RepID=UPI001D1550F7|nr:HXXEE domain-containing protein [Nocardia australiensis]
MSKWVDTYRREWPRVAAIQAMALGGASILASRKNQTNVRALAVMNAMTMCAHQYEEYVDPGYFPGMVNVGIFKSDQPRNYPYNPNSAMCANIFFRALYVPPMLFPRVTWLGLPGAMLGLIQGVGHTTLMPKLGGAKYPYSPGALTAALLHVPIGLTYIRALRAQGGISKSDWIKSFGVLGAFLVLGVAAPNLALKDRNSPYEFTDHQMGSYAADRTVDLSGGSGT